MAEAQEHTEQPASGTALLDEMRALTRELKALAADQLTLAGLEAKLVARNLLLIIASAVGIGVLLASVWFTLMGAIVMGLIFLDLAPVLGVIVLALMNAAGALLLVVFVRRRARALGFPATLRSLRAAASHVEGVAT